MAKLDLIVCAYGDSPFLAECVQSLRAQDSDDTRVLICTSTPSDFIAQVASRFGVDVVVNASAPSLAGDWNFALQQATADYVALCHQDDVYARQYASKMRRAMDAAAEALIGFCDNTEHTATGLRATTLNLRIKRWILNRAFGGLDMARGPHLRRRMLSLGNPVCCPAVVFNRRRLQSFRFSDEYLSNLDWDAWDRIASMQGALVYVQDALVSHRVHAGSQTTALLARRVRWIEDRRMFARYWPAPIAYAIATVYRLSYLANDA